MNIQLDRFPGGKTRCITMSYDDSCFEQNEKLIGIFNQYGVKGTFHMNGSGFEGVNVEEFRKTYEGHEISCHCFTHPQIGINTRETVLEEILRDRDVLEKFAGYPIRGMSYPFGSHSPEVVATLRACGMEYSRTVGATRNFWLPNDFMYWDSTCHHDAGIAELYENFKTCRNASLKVFYIWGHAHEFGRNNNWDVMESFCEKAAQNADDIWFATNIQIVDYVNALKQLRFSLRQETVYNPTCTTVWVSERDGRVFEIKPGLNVLAEQN